MYNLHTDQFIDMNIDILKIILLSQIVSIYAKSYGLPYDDVTVETNKRPVIAILAVRYLLNNITGQSYISAGYVKWLESAGAQVVPIPENTTDENVRKILNNVNGVLIPGGYDIYYTSNFYRFSKLAMKKSMNATKNGDYFPVLGICFGYQLMNVIVSQDSNILSYIPSEDLNTRLTYTQLTRSSRLFRGIPSWIYDTLEKREFAYQNHEYSMAYHTHIDNIKLNNFFKVLSTSSNINGIPFTSTLEAFDYPIYGLQWHPEKIPYEFSPAVRCRHDSENVRISFHMAAFFVNECRKSKQRFVSEEMRKNLLIYNYEPFYSGGTDTFVNVLQQIYIF